MSEARRCYGREGCLVFERDYDNALTFAVWHEGERGGLHVTVSEEHAMDSYSAIIENSFTLEDEDMEKLLRFLLRHFSPPKDALP